MARVPVSKTGGWGFESLLPCVCGPSDAGRGGASRHGDRHGTGEDIGDSDARPSYAALAEEFSLAVTDVTNYLAFARREFRRSVLAQLRDMTGSDEEFQREAQSLLGVDLK